MQPRSVELVRLLKKTGSFYYNCDWHASHYVKGMLGQHGCSKSNAASTMLRLGANNHAASLQQGLLTL